MASSEPPHAIDRATLVQTVVELSPSDLARVVVSIAGAAGHVSRHGSVPERAAELIHWAESSSGPGLEAIQKALEQFSGKVSPTIKVIHPDVPPPPRPSMTPSRSMPPKEAVPEPTLAAAPAAAPTAFVSYSWDDEVHKRWVLDFATRLRCEGIDAKLDRWDVSLGDPLPQFMETAVRENDFVLIVLTTDYRAKSDRRTGGVGYEGNVMTAEIFAGKDPRKFIPILRRGSWDTASPSWLKGKLGVDLRGDPYNEAAFNELKVTLLRTKEKAPPLGRVPKADQAMATQELAVPPIRHDASEPIQLPDFAERKAEVPRPLQEAVQDAAEQSGESLLMATPPSPSKPPLVFVSYSHEDKLLLEELWRHLGTLIKLGIIEVWDARRLQAGDHIWEQTGERLESAEVILLLVSANYLASRYCMDIEMTRSMERHEKGTALVIPVILRPCSWHDLPFGRLLPAPTDGRPVIAWPSRDKGFTDVAFHIQRAVGDLRNPLARVPWHNKPIGASRIYVSYSHRDRSLYKKFKTFLSKSSLRQSVYIWDDSMITAGSEWETEIHEHLESAEVIILVVSANYTSSDYLWHIEMTRAIKRHEEGTALVIPIILRPCNWQHAPFGKLLVAPTDGRPVTEWPVLREAFNNVARIIQTAVGEFKNRSGGHHS